MTMNADKLQAPQPFISYGNFLFKYRNSVFPIVLVGLCLLFRPDTQHMWLPLAGLSVCLLGQLLRCAVIGFAYIKRGGLNRQVYADQLVTNGFFGACRNPLYVGNVLIIGGLLLIHGSPYVILIGGLFFLTAYMAIIATEENYLRKKFGAAYGDYCRDVPRWMIRFGRLPKAVKGMEFDVRKVIYKDYTTFSSWSAQAVCLMAYREHAATGMISPVWMAALAAIGLWLFSIRIVKKRIPL